MVFITYNLGCRNCLQSDGVRHMTMYQEAEFEDYEDKTEFEVMTQVEYWRHKNDQQCEFCDSSNIEVMDIEVNDQPLYDFEHLVKKCKENQEFMIMFNIDKIGSSIKTTPGGSQNIKSDFFIAAIHEIKNTIKQRSPSQFIPKQKGNFLICLTGGYDFNENKVYVKLERFRSSGLTKDEIFNEIQLFSEQGGVKLYQSKKNTDSNKSVLDGKPFKGVLFNSWFYAESLEAAKKGGYSYANACFEYNDSIIIAYGCEPGQSPKEFIENNQGNDFIIDTTKKPLTIKDKTIYLAKKF